MAMIIHLDRRAAATVELPAYRVSGAGAEVIARAQDALEIVRAFQAPRDRYALRKWERLDALLLGLVSEGQRIAAWGEREEPEPPVEAVAA